MLDLGTPVYLDVNRERISLFDPTTDQALP